MRVRIYPWGRSKPTSIVCFPCGVADSRERRYKWCPGKFKLKLKFKQAGCRATTCRAPWSEAQDAREKAAGKAATWAWGPPGPRAASFQENNGIPSKRGEGRTSSGNMADFLVGARSYMQS